MGQLRLRCQEQSSNPSRASCGFEIICPNLHQLPQSRPTATEFQPAALRAFGKGRFRNCRSDLNRLDGKSAGLKLLIIII